MSLNYRTTKNQGPDLSFCGDTACHLTKEVFVSNPKNKDSFIHLLGSHLTEAKHKVLYAPADADVLIAKTAIESAQSVNTVVVGDDTDLLVLLIHNSQHPRKHQDYMTYRRPNSN